MRPNTLTRKLAEGRRVCGVPVDVASEDLVEVFGLLGFDFAVLEPARKSVPRSRRCRNL